MKSIILRQDDNEFQTISLTQFNRITSAFKATLWFYVTAFLVVGLMSNFLNALYGVLILFVVYLIENSIWSTYYITHMVKSDTHLKIEYFKGDQLQTIEDVRQNFSFYQKRVWYKFRGGNADYLVICHNEQELLKQYPIKDIGLPTFEYIRVTFSKPNMN